MELFYYVPLAHENLLADAVKQWTEAPNFSWTIITGIYKPLENPHIYEQENSLVSNVLREGRVKQAIPYRIKDMEENELHLIAFCVQGDLEKYMPDFRRELVKCEGVEIHTEQSILTKL